MGWLAWLRGALGAQGSATWTQELLSVQAQQETLLPAGPASSQPWALTYPCPHGETPECDCKTVQVEHLDLQ